jgi:PTS system nitrogen regulatory IIA component
MQLADILSPNAVQVVGKVSSKKRLLQTLAEAAKVAHGVCPDTALSLLLERESLGPTGVGSGVALPHARLPELDRVVGVFMRLEQPVDFNSVDHKPVDLVFGLFAPEASGVEHLKALALVSRSLRNPELCGKLRSNSDAGVLYTLLTEPQASQAA